MKVVFRGRTGRNIRAPLGVGNVLEMIENDWDDYGHATTFNTVCRIQNEILDLGTVKILFEGKFSSRGVLREAMEAGWNGEFPIDGIPYISVPTEISFYEQLISALGEDEASNIATALRDASYLIKLQNNDEAERISTTEGFLSSLQRERGAQNAFQDGWKAFSKQTATANNINFRFVDSNNDLKEIILTYRSPSLLPHDINVLIGPNGIGKSQLLHQIVRDWIDDFNDKPVGAPGFITRPSLSQIVVLSYSPFERFPVAMAKDGMLDQDVYKYFGLRGPAEKAERAVNEDVLSLDVPKAATAKSLLACVSDDIRFRAMDAWAKKVVTAEEVLKSALDFDFAAVEVERGDPADLARKPLVRPHPVFDGPSGEQFVCISSQNLNYLDPDAIVNRILPGTGVVFFKDNLPVHLSSGQRLFSYIIINLLGAIRRNSLILIDEPELFLHPTLEIQLVDMLKEILKQFNSKALFATHSIVTVREIPADCVHVFVDTNDGIVIQKPPFQTFGGDIQRITSYVFGDSAVTKPFESWIENQLNERTAADLIGLLRDELNEEIIIQIAAIGKDF